MSVPGIKGEHPGKCQTTDEGAKKRMGIEGQQGGSAGEAKRVERAARKRRALEADSSRDVSGDAAPSMLQ